MTYKLTPEEAERIQKIVLELDKLIKEIQRRKQDYYRYKDIKVITINRDRVITQNSTCLKELTCIEYMSTNQRQTANNHRLENQKDQPQCSELESTIDYVKDQIRFLDCQIREYKIACELEDKISKQ